MDEGGFIVDYLSPAGSSLQETNRMVSHVEQMLREIPEVESTSRRTGLELGLAAVTEANRGDIAVKLKSKRDRSGEEIMSELRAKVEQQEPGLEVEFVQVLQDMIGDLSNAPEPVQIKLFSPDAALLEQWAPKVGDAIHEIKGVVDVRNGIENTISGPATVFHVNPTIAARAGFTPEEVAVDATAILEGEPAATPVIAKDIAYTIRVRYPEVEPRFAGRDEQHSAEQRVGTYGDSGLAGGNQGAAGTNGNPTRESATRCCSHGAAGRPRSWQRDRRSTEDGGWPAHLPSSIRVVYGGTYEEQQQSFHDLMLVLMLAILLVFVVLLFEFRTLAAPLAILSSALLSTSGVFLGLLITRTTFNIASFMGLIMVIGIVAKNGILLLDADQKFRGLGYSAHDAMIQAGRRRLRPILMTALAAAAGMLPLALALGAGSQMLQPLAIAVIGGITISMVLSLIITPAVHYYLSHAESKLQ